jgi:hypothetical protein
MPVRAKSVSSTRTLAVVRGSGVHSKDRHVKAFQIAALELERTRRTREMESTRTRMNMLEDRLREVGALIARYQADLGNTVGRAAEVQAGSTARRQTIRYG